MKLHSIVDLLAEWASGTLEPPDREALCGDLAESGVSGFSAVRDVMSLIIRRQMMALQVWRPWVTLILIAIPLGLSLSVLSERAADGSAIYLWLYANNWNLSLAQMPGYWHTLAECLPNVYFPCAVLACSSFVSGLLIGTISRQGRWISSVGLTILLFWTGTPDVPPELRFFLTFSRARDFLGNAAVFATPFYRTIYPEILTLFFSLLPYAYGTHNGIQVRDLSRANRFIVSLVFAASIGALACQDFSWWFFHLWDRWPVQLPGLPSPMALATMGSATCLFVISKRSPKTTRRSSGA